MDEEVRGVPWGLSPLLPCQCSEAWVLCLSLVTQQDSATSAKVVPR